jgi:hypothetical protein
MCPIGIGNTGRGGAVSIWFALVGSCRCNATDKSLPEDTEALAVVSAANVPDDLSLLASGMAPAREAEKAEAMTEVPQA